MMNWALRLIAPWLFLAALGAQAAVAPIVMSVPITPNMAGFVDSLARQPSFAALVLRNAGIPLSFSKPISIDNSTSFRLGNYVVQYLKKSDNVYFYEVRTMTDLGKKVVVPVEIDVADLDARIVRIRMYPEFAGLIPKVLLNQLESRLKNITRPRAQEKLVSYLSARAKNSRTMSDSERNYLDRK
jgi:hypothetical protein